MGGPPIKQVMANGSRFSHYKVIEKIGKGGMGEVYAVQDTRYSRKIALKLLSVDATKDQSSVLRFEQEANAVMTLNHPNIITIFEFGQVDSMHFIATEFIEGATLRNRMDDMSLREALDVAIQVATALEAAHTAGIMHRDIKPENVMIRPDGIVKVLDFGLAKPLDKFAEPEIISTDSEAPKKKTRLVQTEPGTILGTVTYMSPEQAQGQPLDSRTDIFSFGVLLYEMISRQLPFEGNTIPAMLGAIVNQQQQPLARYSRNVPREMERIVAKALEKNRNHRYQTITDLLLDLKRLKHRLDFEAERVTWEPAASAARVDSDPDVSTIRVPPITTSSAQYIIDGIKRHKGSAFFAIAGVVMFFVIFKAFFPTRTMVAVLPFVNESGDGETDGICDSLTRETIKNLGDLPKPLKVISYSDVQRYKGQTYDSMIVGQELRVRAVMIGRVRKDERGGYTINTELVNVSDKTDYGAHGLTYQKFADLHLVTQGLSRFIFETLEPDASRPEKNRLDADDLYNKGRNEWSKRTTQGLLNAIGFFDDVTKIDEKYAKAYAGKADCYNMLVVYGHMRPMDGFPKAEEAANSALGIDGKLAEAHTSLALVKFLWYRDWSSTEQEFQQSIALDANNALSHQLYSVFLSSMARFVEAVNEAQRARQIDPLSLNIKSQFGLVYYFAHQFDQVIGQAQNALDSDPNFFVAHRYLGWAYEQKANYEQAITEFRKASELSPNSTVIAAELAHAYAVSGNRSEAQKLLNQLLAKRQTSTTPYVSAYNIAIVYAGLGERKNALSWLKKAYDDHSDFMVFLRVDPRIDSLRSEPGFEELLRWMDLSS